MPPRRRWLRGEHADLGLDELQGRFSRALGGEGGDGDQMSRQDAKNAKKAG